MVGEILPDNSKEVHRARAAVFRLLKYRLRSEAELLDRLTRKGFAPEIVKITVDYFRSIELVDDRQFARQWIASRLARPLGINRIRYELHKKGIANEIIEDELLQATEDLPEEDVVRQLAVRRASRYGDVEEPKRKSRLYQYLYRKGFTPGVIVRVINRL